MNKSPAFQFYPGDWLSSPKVTLMTPEQEGAYIRLLCYAWDAEDCGLPDDDNELSILSRLGEGWFNGGSTVVRKCFEERDGRLYNTRLLKEREKQATWREKSSEGGKASAKARRAKRLSDAKGGSTVVQPKGNSPSPSPSPSPKSKKEALDFTLPDELISCQQHWDDFLAMRKATRKPFKTQIGINKAINFLSGLGPLGAMESLERSCRGEWQGLFPPDKSQGNTKPKVRTINAKELM